MDPTVLWGGSCGVLWGWGLGVVGCPSAVGPIGKGSAGPQGLGVTGSPVGTGPRCAAPPVPRVCGAAGILEKAWKW